MNKFDILLAEIKECNIRTQSQEVQKVLNHLEHFVNDLGDDWVSVDERLPQDNELVLVYVNNEIKLWLYAVDTTENRCHWWANESGDFISEINDGEVTHWQRLPKSPTLEKEDDTK